MSKVYFLKNLDPQKIKDVLPRFTAILGAKIHFGEQGNTTFIPAEQIKKVVDLLASPTLIEGNTLYKGQRTKTPTHLKLAEEHGFTFAPIDILDGESGDEDLQLKVPGGQYFQSAYFGRGLSKYQSIFFISHFKGHISAGFGGAIKNMSMGLASRRGKLALHASVKHQINSEKCLGCGTCIANCPASAISYDKNNKAHIDQNLCISCSKCMALCPSGAINIPWGRHQQKSLSRASGRIRSSRGSGPSVFLSEFRHQYYNQV